MPEKNSEEEIALAKESLRILTHPTNEEGEILYPPEIVRIVDFAHSEKGVVNVDIALLNGREGSSAPIVRAIITRPEKDYLLMEVQMHGLYKSDASFRTFADTKKSREMNLTYLPTDSGLGSWLQYRSRAVVHAALVRGISMSQSNQFLNMLRKHLDIGSGLPTLLSQMFEDSNGFLDGLLPQYQKREEYINKKLQIK